MESRGVTVIRYADDIVVLAKSKRAAKRLLETSRTYLEQKLKLQMNTQKSKVVSVVAQKHFKFLGFALGKNGEGVYVRAHHQSLGKAKKKLKKLTSRSQGRNARQVMENGYYDFPAQLRAFTSIALKRLNRRIPNGTSDCLTTDC